MLRSKKSETSFLNSSNLNTTILSTQSTSETMEREIDNYTRTLEQDKRKFFRVQENYTEIKKQFDNKNRQLEKLQSKQYKTQMLTLKAKITTLEATLDQTINAYNESLSKNNKLKCEIDELRKDKKNSCEKLRYLTDTASGFLCQMQSKRQQIQFIKHNIQSMKDKIITFRQKNQGEAELYQSQINQIRESFDLVGKDNERKSKQEKNIKTQTIDTQPLVKLRLRNLIHLNKQKLKIIQQYKRHMQQIHVSFEQIKQQSGIQSLQQITKTFLKHQEQNLFIYQYISRLNNTIEELKDNNIEMKGKIQQQLDDNNQRRLGYSGTPEQEKRKRDFQSFRQTKTQKIHEMDDILKSLQPRLLQVFHAHGILPLDQGLQLSHKNICGHLSTLQTLMNNCDGLNEACGLWKNQYKQDVTKYTRLPPALNEELTGKLEEKLFEKDKLKDIANQYWQKKKAR